MTDNQTWLILALGVLNGGVRTERATRNKTALVRSRTRLETPFHARPYTNADNDTAVDSAGAFPQGRL